MKFRISSRLCGVAVAFGALAALGSAAMAQQQSAAAPSPANGAPSAQSAGAAPPILPVNAPANKLHLTADQQKQVQAIREDFLKQQQALIADKTLTNQQKQAKYQTMGIARNEKLMAILTPTQKQTLNQIDALSQKYMAAAKDNYDKAQAVNKQIQASITPAQQKQIASLHKSDDAAAAAIENNKSYSDKDKATKEIAIRKDYQAKVTTLLTAQQKTWIKQLQSYEYEASALQRLAAEQ